MSSVINRLKEPSTWAGLSVLFMLFGGTGIDNETLQALQGIAYALGGATATAAVTIPERGKR